jgi:hypothetical protein
MFKGLTARRLYKSFGVKGLIKTVHVVLSCSDSILPCRSVHCTDPSHNKLPFSVLKNGLNKLVDHNDTKILSDVYGQ